MLYSIIPPILIILSLSGIIIFFMRKAPQIAKLDDAEDSLDFEKEEMAGKAGFFGKITSATRWDNIKHWLLFVLEKVTRRARIMFLKLESQSKNLGDSIRNKRNSRKKSVISGENPEEDDIIERVKNYQPEKKKNYLKELKNKASKDKVAQNHDDSEKKIRPIVSDKVVTPQTKAEMKDRLEDLLIERIAVNPKDIEAYERLGEYYMEIGNLNDSKECFKQVLKLDPKNRNVKYRMRRLENLMHKR